MNNIKTKPETLNLFILVFGLALGAYARLLPTIMIGFPVTDGGMFYSMARAIQNGHYALPNFVEYNGIQIPFAYPPLGFYATAITADIFNIPLIEVFRWLPAIVSIGSTLAFYPLASAILKSKFKGSLAAIFFALLPRSMTWFIMGGGITRAFGFLFLLLTVFSAYNLFTSSAKKYLWMTILFGAGAVLSHPETALHTVVLCAVLFFFFGLSEEGTKKSVYVALGILLLAAPFYVTVIARHGFAPYQNAAQTGLYNFTAWLGLITGSFADEKFITVISALALLGLVVTFIRREYLLAAWWIVPALVDPRGAASISIIAWSMLAALGFTDVIVIGLHALKDKSEFASPNWAAHFFNSPALRIALTGLIFYAFFGAVVSDQVFTKVSLHQPQRQAMQWVEKNTPQGSRFAVVTGGALAFSDALSEWFPALTNRVSVATVQGYEWMSGKPFDTRLGEYDALQKCISQNSACVENWSADTNNAFDYVLVAQDSSLADSLAASKDYQLIYKEEGVFIFKR